jgi:tRNA threonylcarbamoyladenosine biosynthesis protein TsaB
MLLAIETSSDVCGVALMRHGELVYEAGLHIARSHAGHLAPMIADALLRVGASPADVEAVAVSAGPGSYTGLRIGVSTAKGLCLAGGSLLVAVPTLAALGHAARPWLPAGVLVLAALPSRRGEVYVASVDASDVLSTPVASAHRLDALPSSLTSGAPSVMVIGPAADPVAHALGEAGHETKAITLQPSAASVAHLGAARLAAGVTADVVGFEPEYVTAAYVGGAVGS